MKKVKPSGAAVEMMDAAPPLTLQELCIACNVQAEWIIELVEQGVIDVRGQTETDWTFTGLSLVRVSKAQRLQRDLGLNTAGVALALELIAEIEDLRAQLRAAKSSSD
jgi:chaperone modulatory protein CbpM